MTMMRNAALALCLLLLAPVCAAETYRVDLIVFLDKSGGGEAGRRAEAPAVMGAIDLSNTPALAAAGITLVPEEQFALADEWAHLRNSKRYQAMLKLAWTQKDPPADRGPSLRIKLGAAQAVSGADNLEAMSVSPVDGSIALLLGHYLHLDADLVYTGGGASWRLRENRKMKRDELHHLDSPRLGILVKLSKPGAAAVK